MELESWKFTPKVEYDNFEYGMHKMSFVRAIVRRQPDFLRTEKEIGPYIVQEGLRKYKRTQYSMGFVLPIRY